MIKLLIGGSPCTYWSIAQKNNRETQAEGLGWELFKNYLIAKEKFKPDFFLYENNKSASQAIKDQIKQEFNVWDGSLFSEDSGARYIEINSALVSAQNRQRFYVHNCGEVQQPQDRGILLRDVLETATEPINVCQDGKSHTIKAQYFKNGLANFVTNGGHAATGVAKPVRVGAFPRPNGELSTSQGMRVYGIDGKSVTLSAGGGDLGNKTGLYAIQAENVGECESIQNALPKAEVIIHILNGALKDVPRDEEIVVLSMYDGIGTGRYCLDKMGFTNVKYYAYEIDKHAMTIAKDNYPDIIECGDAFQVRNEDWKLTE